MKKITLFLIIILTLSALISCGSSSEFKEKPTVKIGVLTPLTGPNATLSKDVMNAIDLALRDYSLQNTKVELVIQDSQCQPTDGVNGFKKLVEVDNVAAVVGIICSGVANSVAPLAQEYGVPTMLAVASSYQPSADNNWVFKFWPENKTRAEFEAKFLIEELGAKKIAVLYTNNARDKGLFDEFRWAMENFDAQMLFEQAYEEEQNDFKTQLTKLKSMGPDVLFVLGYEPSVVNILKQAYELDLETRFVTTSTVISESFLEAVGGVGEGLLLDLPITRSEQTQKFEDKFIEQFDDSIIHPGAYFTYDTMNILLPVLDQTQNRQQIKNRLFETNTVGVSGGVEFDETGKNTEKKEFGVLKILEGNFVEY